MCRSSGLIVPRIGRLRLDALDPQDVRRLLNSCRDATVKVGTKERPVSPRSVQMVHAVLRNAVEHAVREELVPRNVVKLVRVPAPHYEVGTGLSLAEARRLLATVRTDRSYAVYVLALSAGLRRGELLGLRWADVDLDGGELHVRQAVQRVGGELLFAEPKTRHSPGLRIQFSGTNVRSANYNPHAYRRLARLLREARQDIPDVPPGDRRLSKRDLDEADPDDPIVTQQ